MNWIGYLPPIADQFTEAFNTFFRLGMGYKKKLSDILTVDGKLSYNYGEPATAIPRWINTNLMQLERDHFRTYNAELNAFIKLLPNLKITTGINYNSIFDIRIILDNIPLGIENTYFFIENPIKTLEYFFQANYEIKGNLFFVAGVRFNKQQKYNIIERHSSGLDDQVELNYDYEDNNLLVIPRFAIIYSLNNNNIFKFLYGEAINRPSFFENVQWGYHPVLVPQRIKTLEVNYLANLSSQLSTSLSVFHNQLDKLIERSIVWDESSQIYESYQSNAGEKSTIGAEFVLQSKPTNNLNFELSFTYQNTKNKRNKDVNVGYSPNLLGHLKATYNFNANMIISLTGNYVSEMEALWDTSPQNPSDINSPAKGRIGNKVDGYFNLGTNIRINNLFNSKFYLNAKVSNLLNTDIYYPTTTYSSWTKNGTLASGRGFNLTLGWRF